MRTLLLLSIAMPALAAKPVAAAAGKDQVLVSQVDAELAAELEAADREHRKKVYELRREKAEAMLTERLVEAEAKRRGVDVEALLKAEVVDKIEAPTEADARAMYQQFEDRMQGATFDQVRGELELFLKQRAQQDRQAAFVADLWVKSGAKILLEPVRVPVGVEGAGAWGPEEAKVTIVVFADYECPYCAKGADSLHAVTKKHAKDVRIVYRDFPLDFHQSAVPAAIAARCAGAQGKYREAHDALYASQRDLSERRLSKIAEELQLDAAAYAKCQVDPKTAAAVAADQAAGAAAGVSGTPAFFINGIPLTGAQPAESFLELVRDELARK